jgi:nitrite reductase/ring-hydroxylating ferredoxin subunit
MTRHSTARADQFEPGQAKIVRVADVEVGIFRLPHDEWRAYRNFCPHAGAPVCSGPVRAEASRLILRCPWHAWEFDLLTGRLVGFAPCELDAYRVEVEDGTVYVWV